MAIGLSVHRARTCCSVVCLRYASSPRSVRMVVSRVEMDSSLLFRIFLSLSVSICCSSARTRTGVRPRKKGGEGTSDGTGRHGMSGWTVRRAQAQILAGFRYRHNEERGSCWDTPSDFFILAVTSSTNVFWMFSSSTFCGSNERRSGRGAFVRGRGVAHTDAGWWSGGTLRIRICEPPGRGGGRAAGRERSAGRAPPSWTVCGT